MTPLTNIEVLQQIDRIERDMAAEFEQRWDFPESECIAEAMAQVDWMREQALQGRAEPWPDTFTLDSDRGRAFGRTSQEKP